MVVNGGTSPISGNAEDALELKAILAGKPVRATQSMVGQMSRVWRRPSLTAIEIAWRWLFGIPLFFVLSDQARQILTQLTPEASGLSKFDFQDPWTAATLLDHAIHLYHPLFMAAFWKIVPVAIVLWAIVSAVGRTILFVRMQEATPGWQRRIPAMILLQAIWASALLAAWVLWYSILAGIAAVEIERTSIEPDVVGYLIWVIFLSLAVYAGWAALSWVLRLAPILVIREGRSLFSSLTQSLRAGWELASKLAEVNLVLGIVRMMLIVLAMVFCAAPLPFSDELGVDQMHTLYKVVAVLYLLGSDYFHVVRQQSYLALVRRYRGPVSGAVAPSAVVDGGWSR